jgi:WD40 repeat protein
VERRLQPDGTRVVTASANTAQVWDAAAGKPVTSPLAHQAPVVSAAFSPDGTRIVTASFDNTARIWDIRIDQGSVERWAAVAERSPFVFDGIVLVRRSPPPASKRAD